MINNHGGGSTDHFNRFNYEKVYLFFIVPERANNPFCTRIFP